MLLFCFVGERYFRRKDAKMKTKTMAVLVLVLAAALTSGCGTMAASQYNKSHRLLHGVGATADGRPMAGVGVDLLGDMPQTAGEWATQLAGVAVDAATAYGAYRLSERANSSDSATALPNTITTGNNSPVQITVGNGAPSLHNPNTTMSSP